MKSSGLNSEQDFSFKSLFVPFNTIKAIHYLLLIGIIVFFNGLFNGFAGDDRPQLVENVLIRSLENIPKLFSTGTFYNGVSQSLDGTYYRPLQSMSYTIIYNTLGKEAFPFHFFQISLHLINACLLFIFFKYVFKRKVSFILALIFLVHPVNSEVALYLANTQEGLFFLFGLMSLILIQRSQKFYLLYSILLLLSLLSKESGILFIIISLIYIIIYNYKKKFLIALYSFSAIFIYLILRIHAFGLFPHQDPNSPIQKADFITRLINIPLEIFFYIKTSIFPVIIATDYQWVITKIDFANFIFPLIIDSLFFGIILALILLTFKTNIKYFKTIIFFTLWFSTGLAIHLQIIPLDATVAERWFYFPFVGLLGIIGTAIQTFKFNLGKKHLVIIAVVIILLSVRTIKRSFDWRSDLSLENDLKYSTDAWGIENSIGAYYFNNNNYEEAKNHTEKSITLYPYVINYSNLGTINVYLGNFKEAEYDYKKAMTYGDLYNTYLGHAYLATVYGNRKENIKFIKNTSLKKYPFSSDLWFHLAILEYLQNNKKNALYDIKQANIYDHSSKINLIYQIILNNKKLNIEIKKGIATYSLK